ncbi:MAG: EAL domain-containing protein [Clostridia bacterium]|nr:EAL domain-containing protein [Clostridia bacterium]
MWLWLSVSVLVLGVVAAGILLLRKMKQAGAAPRDDADDGVTIELSDILENMDGAVLVVRVTDKSVSPIYISPAFYKVAHIPENGEQCEDLLGYISPQDRERLERTVREAAQNSSAVDIVYRAYRDGDRLGWFHMRGSRMQREESDSKIMLLVVRDISETKDSTLQLEALLNYAPAGIARLVVSDKWAVEFANDEFIRFFADSREKFEREYERDILTAVSVQDVEKMREAASRSIQDKQSFALTFRLDVKPNTRWITGRAVSLDEKDGKPVILSAFIDVTEQKILEEQLRDDKETLSLAFEQAAITLWEYDRRTKVLLRHENPAASYSIPEGRINCVHPASQPDYLAFFERVESDAQSGSTVIKKREDSNIYTWVKLSFRNIFDESGNWEKTIGVTYKMPHIDAQKARFEQEERFAAAMGDELLVVFKADLAIDEVKMSRFADGSNLSGDYGTYNALLAAAAKMLCDGADVYEFIAKFSPNSLFDSYERGNSQVSCEYRRRIKDGAIEWALTIVRLIVEPISGNLYAFGYTRGIDTRKKWELSLERKATYDNMTALYDMETVQRISEYVMRNEASGSDSQRCALAFFEVENLGEITANSGSGVMSNILLTSSRLSRIMFDDKYVIGSLPNGGLVIFMPDTGTNELIATILNKAAEIVRTFINQNESLENIMIQVRCVVANKKDATYGQIFSVLTDFPSDAAQYGIVRIFEYTPAVNDIHALTANMVELDSKECPDTEETRSFITECLKLIILDNIDSAARKELFVKLGKYFGASRVYSLRVTSDGDEKWLSLLTEWTQTGVKSIYNKLSNVPLKKFPIVKKTIETKEGTVYSDEDNGRLFITTPIITEGEVSAVICVDSPTRNKTSYGVLHTLCTYWAIHLGGQGVLAKTAYIDLLTGLFNRNKYNDVTNTMDVSGLSSMGAVFADINSVSDVNHNLGNLCGDKMIKLAAHCLVEQFGREHVYRVSGDDFVVLAPNLVYKTLQEKALAAADAFNKEYPNGISVGYTWSAKNIKIKELAEHAEDLMKINKQTHREKLIANGSIKLPEVLGRLLDDIQNRRFVVYLQPKADVVSGAVVGAEALVRYNDPQRGIITPVKFIPLYEKQNIIKHIDYFVLEESLKLMSKWKEEGKRVIPIAVNYSRSTLLDSESLAKTRALREKYSLPEDMFELEITESVGSIEKMTVAEACKKYNEAGFRLSLDDFGSEYSSLSILSVIDFKVLKIDKSITDDIVTSKTARAILESILQFCKKLGITTVAEGVEKKEQLDALREANCDIAQGYFIDKPLPTVDFEETYILEA